MLVALLVAGMGCQSVKQVGSQDGRHRSFDIAPPAGDMHELEVAVSQDGHRPWRLDLLLVSQYEEKDMRAVLRDLSRAKDGRVLAIFLGCLMIIRPPYPLRPKFGEGQYPPNPHPEKARKIRRRIRLVGLGIVLLAIAWPWLVML